MSFPGIPSHPQLLNDNLEQIESELLCSDCRFDGPITIYTKTLSIFCLKQMLKVDVEDSVCRSASCTMIV